MKGIADSNVEGVYYAEKALIVIGHPPQLLAGLWQISSLIWMNDSRQVTLQYRN